MLWLSRLCFARRANHAKPTIKDRSDTKIHGAVRSINALNKIVSVTVKQQELKSISIAKYDLMHSNFVLYTSQAARCLFSLRALTLVIPTFASPPAISAFLNSFKSKEREQNAV
jgi:archaellum component FlaF (FlaF/FlaG flagellin family)